MTQGRSIAQRLAIALALTACLMWLGAALIATNVLRDKVNAAFDDTMRQGALRILPLATHEFAEAVLEDELDEMAFVEGLSVEGANYNYYVLDAQGRIVLFSGEKPEPVLGKRIAPGFVDLDGARAFALYDNRTGFGIVVRERPGIRNSIWRDSIVSMLLPLAVLIPFLIALVFWSVHRAMAPLRRLGTAVSHRHKANIRPLNLGAQPRELAPIVHEIDSLLLRLGGAMDAERSFAAVSAHELGTPIAGAIAQLQVLSSKLHEPNYQENLSQCLDALMHLSRLSESLLQLSRLEAGFAASADRVHLNPIIKLVLDETAFTQLGKDIRLVEHPLYAHITTDAFATALRNLLQNADRYRTFGTEVLVMIGSDSVEVSNTCDVVSGDVLATLSLPYVRGQHGLTKGSRLGLAIVAAIARDAGGELKLRSPRTGKTDGFSARLSFSAEPTVGPT